MNRNGLEEGVRESGGLSSKRGVWKREWHPYVPHTKHPDIGRRRKSGGLGVVGRDSSRALTCCWIIAI